MANNLECPIPGWKIIRMIGKGSFGAVYEVEKDDGFGEGIRSALKVISIPESTSETDAYRDDGYDDDSLTAMYKSRVADITAEFRLMSKLKSCNNVVSYEDHTIIQHDGDPGYDIVIRMELLTPLPKYLEQGTGNRTGDDLLVRKLAMDMCTALERCGKQNIIHRDIKPQNIFVNDEGVFKLGDFGIAKTSDHTTRATKTGTYSYMAPEVYWGKPYNTSVDQYSLGLVLYWMLNERRGPFMPLPPSVPSPTQQAEALERRMHGESLPAPKNGSDALKRIVLKACAFDPKDRYANPTEMKQDLERLAALPEEPEFDPTAVMQDTETAGAAYQQFKPFVPEPEEGTDVLFETTAGATELLSDEPEEGTGVLPEDHGFDPEGTAVLSDVWQPKSFEEMTLKADAETQSSPKIAPETPKNTRPAKPEPAPAKQKPEKPAKQNKPQTQAAEETGKQQKSKLPMIIGLIAAALAVVAVAVVLIVTLGGKNAQEPQTAEQTNRPELTPIAEEQPDGSSEEIDLTDVSGIWFESGEEPGFVIEAYIPSVLMTTDQVDFEMQNLIETAETWTEETAPQTLSEFPFLPESVFDLFHNIIENADSHLEKDGDTYTWKTNLAEILPSEYFSEKEIEYVYFEGDSQNINSVYEIDSTTFQFNRSHPDGRDYVRYVLNNDRVVDDNFSEGLMVLLDFQEDELNFDSMLVDITKYYDQTFNIQYYIDWLVFQDGEILVRLYASDTYWILAYDSTGALTLYNIDKTE